MKRSLLAALLRLVMMPESPQMGLSNTNRTGRSIDFMGLDPIKVSLLKAPKLTLCGLSFEICLLQEECREASNLIQHPFLSNFCSEAGGGNMCWGTGKMCCGKILKTLEICTKHKICAKYAEYVQNMRSICPLSEAK